MTSPPDNGRDRPAGAASSDSTAIKSTPNIPPNALAELAIGRRTWARRYIERQTPNRPAYGSTEWLALPDDHPDKVAACVIAAETWACAGDTLEADLRREIEYMRAAHKRREDEEYREAAQSHRATCTVHAGRSFMDRRADQFAAAKPHPGDYMGGPVHWDGGGSA